MADGNVICGFPGVGKTSVLKELQCQAKTYGFQAVDVVDFDTWGYDEDGWPHRYIDDLKTALANGHQLMASTRPEVLKHLSASDIRFDIVYPPLNNSDEYLNRYLSRGMDVVDVRYIYEQWRYLIRACMKSTARRHVILKPGQHFGDVVHMTREGLKIRK